MMNWHGLDVYRRFKWTTKVLVKRAGGSSKAAEIIGMRNRQNVERWYLDDGDNETRSIPLFALLDLESEAVEKCGAPVLIPALAKEFGYRLERLPESAPKDTAVHTVGQLMKEAGVACAAVLDAYEDGKLTRAERETCLRVLGAVQRKLSDAIAIISGAAICEDDDEEAAA